MEPAKRIALLLLGLGVGEILAAEPAAGGDEETSPIFAPRAPAAPRAKESAAQTQVARQLAALIRSDAEALKAVTPAGPTESGPAESGSGDVAKNTLQLEKMTVEGRRMATPPLRETALEKFTRTGYLWEFSKTKRFMIGPKGDKVGVMFSFDW